MVTCVREEVPEDVHITTTGALSPLESIDFQLATIDFQSVAFSGRTKLTVSASIFCRWRSPVPPGSSNVTCRHHAH